MLFTIGGEYRGKSAPDFAAGVGDKGDPDQDVYERTADDNLEVRLPAKSGVRVVAIAFVDEFSEPEGALQNINSRPESLRRFSVSDLALDDVGGAQFSPQVARELEEAEQLGQVLLQTVVSSIFNR